MDKDTTLIVFGLGVVAFLGALYFLSKPKPSNDVSWSQAATMVATVAEYW